MIDIHAHILPGIDDGAADIYETLEMADIAVQSGVRAIIATPHTNIPGIYDNYFGKEYIEAYNRATDAIEKEQIPLKILPGMEAFATYNLPRLIQGQKIMPLNRSRYILIEFAFDEDPKFAERVLDQVKEVRAWPIIAHAERYDFLQDNPQIAYKWLEKGYMIQANKSSYIGRFGVRARDTMHELLSHHLISVIASDAHSSEVRTPYMRDVYKEIRNDYSNEMAELLFKTNPERVCKNLPMQILKPISF